MKIKTMNAVIAKKMNDWLSSIKDESLRSTLKNKIIVTGGSITSMLLNEEVNDYDIYLTDKEVVKELSQYYCNEWNEIHKDELNKLNRPKVAWVLDGEDVELWKDGRKNLSSFAYDYPDIPFISDEAQWHELSHKPSNMIINTDKDRIKIIINSDGIGESPEIEISQDEIADNVEYDVNEFIDELNEDRVETPNTNKEKYRPVFLSSNAITLSDKIQIIIRFYGEPEVIHSNYDFIHTTNYWTFKTGVVVNERALLAIMNKELFYSGSKYPIASIIRTRKFIKRGWQISAGQYLKMAFQISALDLNDISVLEDQLVGVDSIYFLQFIKSVHEDIQSGKLNKDDVRIDSTYVVSVVDKIFG